MSINTEEAAQFFKNAKAAQNQYFNSVIQLIERLELKIKVLEEKNTQLESKIRNLEGE